MIDASTVGAVFIEVFRPPADSHQGMWEARSAGPF
jgi:hypothetical protein